MKTRHVLWQIVSLIIMVSMFVFPASQGIVSAQADRPEPASPVDGTGTAGTGLTESGLIQNFTTGGLLAAIPGGGDRLAGLQNPDGGWGWDLTGPSALNTIGPIATGLALAYQHLGDPAQKTALQKAGAYLLAKSTNFSPSDGSLAAKLDEVFGGTTYRDFVIANYYGPLDAGTYNRNGAGTNFTTASYINLIRTSRGGNLAAWDLGTGLVGAAMAGAPTVDWVSGVEAEIDELVSGADYDVLGLAGAVYGLAYVGADFDPTTGSFAGDDSVSDLAATLATFQIGNGGFSYTSTSVIPGNETNQETAYATLALNQVSSGIYFARIQGAANYLIGVQLSTGGWNNYAGDPLENNELTGEALWGISASVTPEVWTKYPGDPLVTGSQAFDPSVIKDGDTYRMWYTHFDSGYSIYYADSSDGITWSIGTQVLSASGTSGAYDEARVMSPSVIKDGSTYKMWFMARNAQGTETIGYATSTSVDGKTGWNKEGTTYVMNVGAPESWDSQKVRDPSVIKDGSTYKMWYSGTASWPVFKIGYAESSNGIAWTKNTSNPIFTGNPTGWDGFQVYAPSVVKDGSTYHLFFSGTDNNFSQRWSTGHALSTDGIDWTESPRNPILIPDEPSDSLDYVGALNDNGTWKVWYSTTNEAGYYIGLATQTEETQLWLDPAVASIKNDGTATQTYNVHISNATGLAGYQFVITYDPTKLVAKAAAFDNSFFPASPLTPPGWNATIVPAEGKIYFARSLMAPALPLSGDGVLGTVSFSSISGAPTAAYKIDFVSTKLTDYDANVLPFTTQYAWLALYGVGSLRGSVDLQGRTVESGGVVTIANSAGYTASTIVAGDGSWSFLNIPAGDYQVNIEMARYLDAQKGNNTAYLAGATVAAGSMTTMTSVKLLGGDAIDDDIVNIDDAVIIGNMFGKSGAGVTDQRADITNDDTVDILDLVLLGGNYDKVSPVLWP